MKKSFIDKLIRFIFICVVTIEIGVTIGFYMLSNVEPNNFTDSYKMRVVR